MIVGVNVFAADDAAIADRQRVLAYRARALLALNGQGPFTDAGIDALLAAPEGAQLAGMTRFTAADTAADVRDYLTGFAAATQADELILVHMALEVADRLRSVELTANR